MKLDSVIFYNKRKQNKLWLYFENILKHHYNFTTTLNSSVLKILPWAFVVLLTQKTVFYESWNCLRYSTCHAVSYTIQFHFFTVIIILKTRDRRKGSNFRVSLPFVHPLLFRFSLVLSTCTAYTLFMKRQHCHHTLITQLKEQEESPNTAITQLNRATLARNLNLCFAEKWKAC